jgi:hypothetical protein
VVIVGVQPGGKGRAAFVSPARSAKRVDDHLACRTPSPHV